LYKFRLPLGIAGVATILAAVVLIAVELLAMIERPAKTASISKSEIPAVVNPMSDVNVVASDDRYPPSAAVVVFELDCKTTLTTSVGIEKTYEKG
jgi:hypothetical protein